MFTFFKHAEDHLVNIFVGILFLISLLFFTYWYFNQPVLDTRDYSEDKNIEDNFVLPPQKDDKYFHFSASNTVSVVNYFSLDCQYCKKLFNNENGLIEQYKERVNFVYRDKVLQGFPYAFQNALIKECVYVNNNNSNEKYFSFVKEVFEKYSDYSDNNIVREIAKKYITNQQLEECLSNSLLRQKVLGYTSKAEASQIVWTPTIVVFKDGQEVERIEKVWIDIYRKVLEKYAE